MAFHWNGMRFHSPRHSHHTSTIHSNELAHIHTHTHTHTFLLNTQVFIAEKKGDKEREREIKLILEQDYRKL